ncbi:MAG: DUF4367 domain-containing protein [Anaerolineae bacterium]|nr:DUF4367 domain-containing protein [Anaerolineae bacterium]
MKHPTDGQLRALLDGEIDAVERKRIATHLVRCSRCAHQLEHLQAQNERVTAWLSHTDPSSARPPVSAQAARKRFDTYLEKKETTMFKILFAKRYRPAWAALALVLALAIAFSFAPVRTLAANLLALFRVQKIQFVQVDPASIPDEDTLETALRALETMTEDEVDLEINGGLREVDLAAARALPDFKTRFPAALSSDLVGEPRVTVRPGVHAKMRVDLERVQDLMVELGYGRVDLPQSLDGAEVKIDMGTLVAAMYGACGEDATRASCTALFQMPAPELSAPDELDIDRLGHTYLQLLGLSESEAERFSQRVDWMTTLVVPMPQMSNLNYQDVSVDGVNGTLIASRYGKGGNEYLLTWIKDGIVYALTGVGEAEETIKIANSMK